MTHPPVNTHQLNINIARESFDMIPYIKLFVDNVPHTSGNHTLTWLATSVGDTAAQFVTASHFSDGCTHLLARHMLTQCLAWLSPMVNGEAVELAYSLAAYRAQGTLQNINGAPVNVCHCSGRSVGLPQRTCLEKGAEFKAATAVTNMTPTSVPSRSVVHDPQPQENAWTTHFLEPSLFNETT